MKKTFFMTWVCTICTICLLVSGCGGFDLLGNNPSDKDDSTILETEQEPLPYPVVINGKEIMESPAEIICLSPVLTEILFEFGAGDRLIGRSIYCDYPESVSEIEAFQIGSGFDTDKIISLSPDLLLLSSPIPEKDKTALEREGIVTVAIPAPRNLDEFQEMYRLIGLILDGIFIGADEGETRFADIALACDNKDGIDLGDFIYITENMSPATGDTLESAVLSRFGNNLAKGGEGYVFDKEELLEKQPALIILNSIYSIDDLEDDEILSQLDAVSEEKVFTIDNAYFERPSARLVELIRELQNQY